MNANSLSSLLLSALDRALDSAHAALQACSPPLASFLQPTTPALKLNTTTYRVSGHLGSGGFSTVLLAQPTATASGASVSAEYRAIKKMRCVRGTEMLAHARRETTAYRVFAHANLVHMMDAAEIAEDNGDVTVYMVFPVLKEIGQERMQEKEVVRVFLGVCRALEYLHTYEGDARLDGGAPGDGETGRQARAANPAAGSPSGYAPLTLEDADDSPSARTAEPSTPPAGYVHGDVKLANVMLTSTNTPVLLDLGSIRAAHQTAQTRHQALCIQDTAAEHCTMAYRAPELFDVQRGATLDARTDVWALGCLLYALAFGQSPFELSQDSQGASVALAAVNANYRVPEDSPYSDRITRLIAYMLEPDPLRRPFVGDVISLTRSLYPDIAS